MGREREHARVELMPWTDAHMPYSFCRAQRTHCSARPSEVWPTAKFLVAGDLLELCHQYIRRGKGFGETHRFFEARARRVMAHLLII